MNEGTPDKNQKIEMTMDVDWDKEMANIDGSQDKAPDNSKSSDPAKIEATMDVDWSAVSEEIGGKIEKESKDLQKAREALGIQDTSDSASIVALRKEQEKAREQIPVAVEKPATVSAEPTIVSSAPTASIENSENPVEKMITAFGQYNEDAKAFDSYVKLSKPDIDNPEFVSKRDDLLSRGREFYQSDWSLFYDKADSTFKNGLSLHFNKLRTIIEDGLVDGSYVLGGVKHELKSPQDFAKTIQNIGYALEAVKSMFDYRNRSSQRK